MFEAVIEKKIVSTENFKPNQVFFYWIYHSKGREIYLNVES